LFPNLSHHVLPLLETHDFLYCSRGVLARKASYQLGLTLSQEPFS